MMAESLAGQLLLASPSLLDPNFSRTVVLVGAHDEEGAMGVVLNRPSTVTVAEAVPQLEGRSTATSRYSSAARSSKARSCSSRSSRTRTRPG